MGRVHEVDGDRDAARSDAPEGSAHGVRRDGDIDIGGACEEDPHASYQDLPGLSDQSVIPPISLGVDRSRGGWL